MGSGLPGQGCRNASAVPSTSVRPSRWEIHCGGAVGSQLCRGVDSLTEGVGMLSATATATSVCILGRSGAFGAHTIKFL